MGIYDVRNTLGVWSWGSGSGGKLGMGTGDNKDRLRPTLIPSLEVKTEYFMYAMKLC